MTDDEIDKTDMSPEQRIAELEARIHELHRGELTRWAESIIVTQHLHEELSRMRNTVSWKVTAPLRIYRRKQLNQ